MRVVSRVKDVVPPLFSLSSRPLLFPFSDRASYVSRPSSTSVSTTPSFHNPSSSTWSSPGTYRQPRRLVSPASSSSSLSLQQRGFVNLTGGWLRRDVQYTKYRIAKPLTDNTMFDDIYLADPTRDDFAKLTKETPLFLRFLKLVCSLENRSKAFVEFAKRCDNGLLVEKDVYITKEELLKCIWENGYTETEVNAFEIAFPSDYKFHYPELAVLFDLTEENCYKYCIRQRAANPQDLVELLHKKPANLLSSYGLIFLILWNGLSNQTLSNAWFYSKTFPFGAVFFMLAAYFSRDIRAFMTKHSKQSAEHSLIIKRKYDETLYTQMKKYANDARCLEFLSSFRGDVQAQMANYHRALALQQQQELVDRLTQKLMSIQQGEKAIQGSLQETIVREVIGAFREAFVSSSKVEDEAFSSAVRLLGTTGEAHSGSGGTADPVGMHFVESLRELQSIDFDSVRNEGAEDGRYAPVAKRLLRIFLEKEKEFLDQFTVKTEEAAEVKGIVSKCEAAEGEGFDFAKLSTAEQSRLDELYRIINSRVGFELSDETKLHQLECEDSPSKSFVDLVNQRVRDGSARLRHARLSAFAKAFQ